MVDIILLNLDILYKLVLLLDVMDMNLGSSDFLLVIEVFFEEVEYKLCNFVVVILFFDND